MHMMFGNQEDKKQTYLVFDVGSNSVAGSWVRVVPGSRPVILFTKRVFINIYENVGVPQLRFTIRNSLREVLTFLLPHAPCPPDKAFVFLSSPWYAAQTRTITYSKRHPFIFSKRFADDLVAQEFEKFQQGQHREWKKLGDGNVPLEHKTMHVKLNGYTYRDPLGKKTERVELVSFMSMMPTDIRDELEHIIHSTFHVDIDFHTSAFASYFSLAHIVDVPEDHIILDIRGETTDMVIVRNGYIEETISLPMGDHTIVRAFANQLNKKPLQVEELLSMYSAGELDEATSATIRNAKKKSLEHVESLFIKAFEQIAVRGLLPYHMYLYTQPEYRDWYYTILADSRMSQYVSLGKSFDIHDGEKMMKGKVLDEEVVLDPFIVADTFFIAAQLLEKK